MRQKFDSHTKVKCSFFGGLIHVTHESEYTFSNLEYNSEENTLKVVISVPELSATGSPASQTAMVLGGTVESYDR